MRDILKGRIANVVLTLTPEHSPLQEVLVSLLETAVFPIITTYTTI
jgi:hypothetical protein